MEDATMNEKGTVYFFTGLAGAGKTTIGGEFYRRLKSRSPGAILMDGDTTRAADKAFDYSTEARRQGGLTKLRKCRDYAAQGHDVVICMIAMYNDVRAWARENIENYKEIYVKVSMETLCKRDQKGLYTKIRKDVVGVDLPYDEPDSSDVVILNEGGESPEDIVDRLEREFGLVDDLEQVTA